MTNLANGKEILTRLTQVIGHCQQMKHWGCLMFRHPYQPWKFFCHLTAASSKSGSEILSALRLATLASLADTGCSGDDCHRTHLADLHE